MFKNFGKVFKFTFKNQVSPSGYRNLTIITAVILFIIPVAIFMIVGKESDGKDKKIEECGAQYIYVVDPEAPDADFNALNMMGIDGYTDIKYINKKTVEEALETIKNNQEPASFILQIKKEDNRIYSRIVLPEDSILEEDKVSNYEDFIGETERIFLVLASGVSMSDLSQMMQQSEYSVYDTDGYKTGTDLYSDTGKMAEQQNSEIKPVFNMILIYVTLLIIYMIIIFYGNSIMQTVILEKTSKLMDTMLISISPKSMIFGKMLGVLTSGIMQLLIWIASAVLGIFTGVKFSDHFFGSKQISIVEFFKSFSELGLFKPVNVLIGILALLFGIIMYASLSAMCGAISSTREEAASNQSIFIIILVLCFYLVLFKGLNTTEVATWLYLFPFSSAMLLPAGVCIGTISTGVAAAGLAIMVACSVLFITLAGKLYSMMSLYKGNKVGFGKAFKMLLQK